MRRIKGTLSYANVMSTLCLFLLLGGAAYAATKLPKNSVGTKQIKNGAVTGAKIKKNTITGTNINLARLGTVPTATTATTATTAGTANGLTPPEALHLVNAPGEPGFEGGSFNLTAPNVSGLPPASFYKDHEGIVHLEGIVMVGKEEKVGSLVPIFTLPAGFRPANGVVQILPAGGASSAVIIGGAGSSLEGHSLSGTMVGTKETSVILSGLSFRAQG
jgi:hypothetical protein